MTAQNGVNTALTRPERVLPRPFTDGGICHPPPFGVFKNELYKRHDFNVECRRGYKYENSQHFGNFSNLCQWQMPLSPGKDEWQIPYPSGTENWQILHSISVRGTLGDSLDISII